MASLKNRSITLVLGAISSGKSKFAEGLIAGTGDSVPRSEHETAGQGHSVRYFATMLPVDEEMRAKIKAHQDRRPANWQTVDPSEIDLSNILKIADDVVESSVMIDSAGTMMSYFFELTSTGDALAGARFGESARLVVEFVERLSINPNINEIVIVSEEVGGGLVSVDPAARSYVAALGDMNQHLAQVSDQVYLVVSGLNMRLKGSMEMRPVVSAKSELNES